MRDEDSEEYTVGDFVEDDILAELAAESQGDVSTLGASSSVVYKGPKGSLHRTQRNKRTSRPVDWEYEFTKVVCKGDGFLKLKRLFLCFLFIYFFRNTSRPPGVRKYHVSPKV